jgi:uncharacterized membrane protein YbhN (UPF0104 family)
MQQRFRSRIDGWLVVPGLLAPLLLGAALLFDARRYGGLPWWSALPPLLTAVLFVWLLASTSYQFDGASLRVRSGPFRWRIPLEQIFAVYESDTMRSGPALSMDRLEIRFGNERRMVISPRDKVAFLQVLHRKVPGLHAQVRGATPRT